MPAIVGQHLAHFLLRKAHHLVETICEGVVRADIESAGEVIEGDGADPGDEDTLDSGVRSCLDRVEERAQITRAVRLSLVFIQTGGIGEDVVGEVVVFIDEEVYFRIRLACFPI